MMRGRITTCVDLHCLCAGAQLYLHALSHHVSLREPIMQTRRKKVSAALGVNWKDSNHLDTIIDDEWKCIETSLAGLVCVRTHMQTDLSETMMSWCFLIVSFRSMCWASRWCLGLRRKSGDICVANASGSCSFPFPFFSLWQRCAENNNRKMVLAPKWNLQRGASCLLAGAGSFALEEQIQTWNTLFAHWTGSNKATAVTSLLK